MPKPASIYLNYGASVSNGAATAPLTDIKLTPPSNTDTGTLTAITRSVGYDWFKLVFKGEYYTYYYDTSTGWSYETNSAAGISQKDLDIEVLKRINNAYELPVGSVANHGKVVMVSENGNYELADVPSGNNDYVIVFSGGTRDNDAACNRTLQEIKEAYSTGKTLKCWYRTSEGKSDDMLLQIVTDAHDNSLVELRGRYTYISGSCVEERVCMINTNGVDCLRNQVNCGSGEVSDDDPEVLV